MSAPAGERERRETTRALRRGTQVRVAVPAGLLELRWGPAEIVFWVFAVAVFFLFPGRLVLASQVLITGLFALSLDLILGYAGIVSLGHAAMFGSGAYTAGLLASHGWGEPITGMLLAAAVGAAIAFATSFIAVRGGDLTRLMVTLGIGLMLYEIANQSALTGGVDGLSDMAVRDLFGLFHFDLAGRTAYLYSLAVLFLAFCVCRRIVRSPFALSLRGIRENPFRMAAIGSPVRRRLIAIYVIGGGVAGTAGALLAQTTQFVGLEVLGFSRSAEVLIMLILGGTGWLYGGLIGAAVFITAQSVLSDLNPVYWQFWLGLLLVAIVLLGRGSALGAVTALRARLRRRSG